MLSLSSFDLSVNRYGPQRGLGFCRRMAHLSRGEFQDFLHLAVPVSPAMSARQFSELVPDFSFEKDCSHLTIRRDKAVLSPAVKIEEGKRCDLLRWQISDKLLQVVCRSHRIIGSAEGLHD